MELEDILPPSTDNFFMYGTNYLDGYSKRDSDTVPSNPAMHSLDPRLPFNCVAGHFVLFIGLFVYFSNTGRLYAYNSSTVCGLIARF